MSEIKLLRNNVAGKPFKRVFKLSVSLSKEKKETSRSPDPLLIGLIILTSVPIFLTRRRLVTCFLCKDAIYQTVYHKGVVDFGNL